MLLKIREIIPIINHFADSPDQKIKAKISKCYYTISQIDKDFVYQYSEKLFSFFIKNFSDQNYEQSYIASQYFLYIISKDEIFLLNNEIKKNLKNNLPKLLQLILKNMILSDKDINYLDTKFQNEFAIPTPNNITPSASGSEGTGSGTNSNGTNSNSNSNSNNGSGNGSSNSNSNGSFSTEGSSTNDYNPDSTLRKCCSRFLDDISFIFPQDTFKIIRPSLDHEMQSRDDLVKERSILAFGAVAQGCSNQVISHLNNVIPFLIRELQHRDKFVRAITCWTLSRYTKFILIDNYNENREKLFKEFLIEILKKMLDKEHMVREAAMITFQKIITCNPNSVEPYLFDVLRVITSIFFTYTGNNLISVYYILNLLMENYREIFQNQNFVDEIVECLVQKWDELVKNYDLLTLPFFFEVIISLIRVRGYFRVEICKYFLTGCLKIIEINVNEMRNNNYSIINVDKEVLIKSINMITALSQNFPSYIKSSSFEKNIIGFLFEILKLKDINIQNHVIVLFGFLMKADSEILKNDCVKLLQILIPHIEFISNKKDLDNDKFSLCDYSSWTIGLIAKYYPKEINNLIDKFFEQLKENISFQKVIFNIFYLIFYLD
jgi:transportin-1